jgi:hypothetical protein
MEIRNKKLKKRTIQCIWIVKENPTPLVVVVVVLVVVAFEPCTTSKPPDRPSDRLSSSLFLHQRQGNRKLAAWAWDGRLHYFYSPEEMAPLNTRSGKAFRSSSYKPSSNVVGHGFKMPCSWCPVDCIWVAIPVLPLLCWKSFLECGTDLLWTDILSGVGLDSNIVMKYPLTLRTGSIWMLQRLIRTSP